MPKYIGLSLSFCVRDIALGLVSIDDVEKIIASTKAVNGEAWERVISSYKRDYWKDFPVEAELIAAELISAGKVIQPRLTNPNYKLKDPLAGHWQVGDKRGFIVNGELVDRKTASEYWREEV